MISTEYFNCVMSTACWCIVLPEYKPVFSNAAVCASTISCCTPTEIARQQSLQAIFKAHFYIDRHLLVSSTYICGKAQTPFGRLLLTYYISKFVPNTQETSVARVL